MCCSVDNKSTVNNPVLYLQSFTSPFKVRYPWTAIFSGTVDAVTEHTVIIMANRNIIYVCQCTILNNNFWSHKITCQTKVQLVLWLFMVTPVNYWRSKGSLCFFQSSLVTFTTPVRQFSWWLHCDKWALFQL